MISKYFNSPDDLYIHEKNKKRNMIINSKVKNNDISHKKHKFQNPYFNVFKPNTKIQFIVTKYSSIN
jgi:hypothetical protein